MEEKETPEERKKRQEPVLATKAWSLTKALMRYGMAGFPNITEAGTDNPIQGAPVTLIVIFFIFIRSFAF